ncbi:MAG: hypothetical protein LH645_02190 [Actinomycetia bacterium]|nr:hypothetical protein [Actinomycetes bacterium]
MRRLTRLGLAAAVAVASLSPLVVAAPAQAAGSGPHFKIVSYSWVPRTGNLDVTARVDCPRQVWNASWSLKVEQRVSAQGFQKISCTGEPQLLTLALDPKNGRFHPGSATQALTTNQCISDFCTGLALSRDMRIPPPGHNDTPGA